MVDGWMEGTTTKGKAEALTDAIGQGYVDQQQKKSTHRHEFSNHNMLSARMIRLDFFKTGVSNSYILRT